MCLCRNFNFDVIMPWRLSPLSNTYVTAYWSSCLCFFISKHQSSLLYLCFVVMHLFWSFFCFNFFNSVNITTFFIGGHFDFFLRNEPWSIRKINTRQKWSTCSGLMKTGLNNILLPTLFRFIDHFLPCRRAKLHFSQSQIVISSIGRDACHIIR